MNEIRKFFPALSHSTYLNTPANGLLPEPVFEWRRKQDINFLNNSDEFRMNHKKKINDTKQLLAEFYDSRVEDIAMVPNFSFGINMVLEGLGKGKKILLLNDDYPSVNWPVETRDFEVFFASIDENLEKNVEEAVEKHKPDVFLFSMVQWLSGIKIDFEFLKKLKSNHPDLLIIGDGTQYIGTEIFSFDKSALDVMAASGYKWLTAGFGNGFLMIKESARQKIKTYTAGFNSAPSFESGLSDLPFMNHFEPGHQDSTSYGTIMQSIEFLKSLGVDKCYSRIRQLSKDAKSELTKLGFLQDAVVHRELHSNIFNLKGDKTLFEKLNQNQISSSPRGCGIRVGFHYYNNGNDLDKLIEVLKK